MSASAGKPLRPFLLALAAVSIVLLGWTLRRGQDVNWDWQNYHLYDVLALLHGRLQADVAPGGPQSFLNPLPYLLPYLARCLLPPVAAGLLVGMSQVLPILVCWAMAWRLYSGRTGRGVVAAVAALCACTGAVVLTETGTSFCDVVLATLPLLGLFLLLPRRDAGQPAGTVRLLLSGALVGLAVGMKPTGLFLLPATAAAALAATPRPSVAAFARALLLPASGAVLGALLSDGAWAFLLWRRYGSPVFPFMNQVFQSNSAVPISFADPRYRWQGVGHALALPFMLAWGTDATGEVPVRDVRLALALPLSLAVLLRPVVAGRDRTVEPLRILAAWLLTGSGFWLLLDPLQRYAAPLEMLGAVLVVVVAARVADLAAARHADLGPRLAGRARAVVLTAVLALLALTTRSADFFHRAWSDAFVPHVPGSVPAGATYGLLTQPLSYWIAQVPRPAHAFTLMSGLLPDRGLLQRRLDRIVDEAGDRLWLLNLDHPVDALVRAEMARHGLVLMPPCLRTANMVWIDSVFCRGERAGPRADAASDLAPNRLIRFSSAGTGLIYEISGWEATDADGTWASGTRALLAFRPTADDRDGSMVLTITTSGLDGPPPRHVTATAGGGAAQEWIVRPRDTTTHRLCIGAERAEGDVLRVRFDTNDVRSLKSLGLAADTRPLAFRIHEMKLVAAQPQECGRAMTR